MADKKKSEQVRWLRPRCAVAELKDGRLQVEMEMPGVRREDLDVRIEHNELRVHGKRDEAGDFKYLLRERQPGDFVQTFTLDETVDQSKVDAVLEKGVLTLTLDLKEQVKPRTIKLRAE